MIEYPVGPDIGPGRDAGQTHAVVGLGGHDAGGKGAVAVDVLVEGKPVRVEVGPVDAGIVQVHVGGVDARVNEAHLHPLAGQPLAVGAHGADLLQAPLVVRVVGVAGVLGGEKLHIVVGLNVVDVFFGDLLGLLQRVHHQEVPLPVVGRVGAQCAHSGHAVAELDDVARIGAGILLHSGLLSGGDRGQQARQQRGAEQKRYRFDRLTPFSKSGMDKLQQPRVGPEPHP